MGTRQFADAKTFHAWHDTKCAEKGIPRPGYNQLTGEVALDAQWTVAWVEPRVIDGALCVELPDTEITKDATLKKLPVKEYDRERAVIEPVAFPVAKPLPATWDDNGTIKPVPRQIPNATPVMGDAPTRSR